MLTNSNHDTSWYIMIFRTYVVSSTSFNKSKMLLKNTRLCTLNPGYPAVAEPSARRRRGGGPERPRCCSMSWGDRNLKPKNPDLKHIEKSASPDRLPSGYLT